MNNLDKRYLLFKFTTYYPDGGWFDLEGAYHSIREAKAHVEMTDVLQKAQIIKLPELKMVAYTKRAELGDAIEWVDDEKL